MGRPIEHTKEKCFEKAKLCKTKVEFMKKYSNYYWAAITHKWFKSITKHMIPAANILQRLVYVYEFPNNVAYVGLTYNIERRDYDHRTGRSAVREYADKNKISIPEPKIISPLLTIAEAQKLEIKTEKKYIKKGWVTLNKMKPGALGGGIELWDKKKCMVIVKKCNSRTDFHERFQGAVAYSKRYGFYEECVEHLPKQKYAPVKIWTYETCLNESKKYQYLKDFINHSKSAYTAAWRDGFLEEITSHMKRHAFITKWTKEACHKEALKYTTLKDFNKNSRQAYKVACENKYLKEITQHLIRYVHKKKQNVS
jgi:predicted GIY-YIG superfamily endonuclease